MNVFCLGIAKHDAIVKGQASGVGNPVYYVGAKTGRDGIHGATMASAEFDDKSAEKRPAVQVGDPFMEKLLLEACLEVMATDACVGVQDMGAAGLTCSTSETGSRGGVGVEIDVALVPQRETGMTPYEIMLSESQERMLLIVKRGREAEVERIFEKWDLHAVRIGEVMPNDRLRVKAARRRSSRTCRTARSPTRRRCTRRPVRAPEGRDELQRIPREALRAAARSRRRASGCCSRPRPSRASAGFTGSTTTWCARTPSCSRDSARASCASRAQTRALAMSVDGNGRFCRLDPRQGARLAVAEAARNVACAGGLPIGATNCLNFGNPERPEIMWQFAEAVAGIGEACRALDLPITGGNVSLYNETDGARDSAHARHWRRRRASRMRARVRARAFPAAGLSIVLLGENHGELGGSEYLKTVHGLLRGRPPALDLAREAALQRLLVELAARAASSSPLTIAPRAALR